MELPVFKYTGEKTKEQVTLADEVFGIIPNEHVVYLAVKHYLANQRQGTHKTKEKGERTGSTRKLRKQKGSGAARVGSIKSPIFRGGGRIFGPRPRDYGFKLNKKTAKLARKSILSQQAQASHITIVEDFSFEMPKTKAYLKVLADLSLSQEKTLFITGQQLKNVVMSARNIPTAKVVSVDSLNVYDLLNASRLIISKEALKHIIENLK